MRLSKDRRGLRLAKSTGAVNTSQFDWLNDWLFVRQKLEEKKKARSSGIIMKVVPKDVLAMSMIALPG